MKVVHEFIEHPSYMYMNVPIWYSVVFGISEHASLLQSRMLLIIFGRGTLYAYTCMVLPFRPKNLKMPNQAYMGTAKEGISNGARKYCG